MLVPFACVCQVRLTDGNYVSIRKVTHVRYKIVRFEAVCRFHLHACVRCTLRMETVSIRKVTHVRYKIMQFVAVCRFHLHACVRCTLRVETMSQSVR